MRIMILANDSAGLYKFRKELMEELVKREEVRVCLPQGSFVKHLKDIGVKYIPCDCLERHGKNLFKEKQLFSYYQKILREYMPDIVFTYTIKPNVYGGMACAKLNIPYVANITGLGTAVENGGILQRITTFLYKRGLRKAQIVFFQNKENMDFMLKRRIIKTRYELLPGSGVNLKQYRLMEYPNNKEIHFLFIARIMKEKGIDQYLEAAEYIRGKYSDVVFHVCGICEQDYARKLEELQKKDIIVYHGLVEDMVEMQKISSCTIHPTYYPEGMSNVLLESAASGRPIITTNRPGCREIVEDEINGYIVKEKDSKDLIEKLEKFMGLSWEQKKNMGLAGRSKVEREFDRRIVIDKYMKELKN